MSLSSRAVAATIITKVLDNHVSLNQALKGITAKKDAGFIQELCYGVLRWHEQLAAIVELLLDKPLKAKDQDIEVLLLIGLYQLIHIQKPIHAALNETVQAARELKKPWATGLINAVLRSFSRDADNILEKLTKDYSAHYSHPQWLLDILKQAWPKSWLEIMQANNQRPPMTLRVNQLKISRADYLKKLAENNIAAEIAMHTRSGIILQTPCDVFELPGFKQGEVSVQDAAAQLAAELLDLKSELRVLDACAAPGGKTACILEAETNLSNIVAMDVDADRLQKVTENLQRLRLTASNKINIICGDAGLPEQWWDQQLFDRILLDVPCSATGVIRRHPDIKYLRREDDIVRLAAQQLQILTALWPLLKPDGILVYATCSVLPQENSEVIKQFLATNSDAQEAIISAKWGIKADIGRQILTGQDQMDGFYYAKLRKVLIKP